MKLNLSKFKSFKSRGVIVFTFLVVLRIVLWFSMEWPSGSQALSVYEDRFVKINNLPIHFLVYWPDSTRYWPSSLNTFKESLSFIIHDKERQYHLQYLFFLPFRLMTNNIAYGVLAQNILSLISAWMLFVMLRPHGKIFAAFAVFISFANLFTLSMEYALLREVLTRFLLILLLYLLWRMVISPSWKMAIAVGVTLFLIPLSRAEYMIITVLITPLLLWRFLFKYILVIIFMGILGIYTYINATAINATASYSKFFIFHQLRQNLLVSSYNYDSPDLGDLPKRIYAKALECKSLYGVDPHWPSFRYQGFEVMIKKTIKDWKNEKGIHHVKKDYYNILFLDVLKNNTKHIVYSALYSFWSYMTGNLVTISPLIYSGDNPNYKFGWPYYSTTNLMRFNDPLSELSPDKRGPKWITTTMLPLSEYWLRKICAPFFFIGLFCIGRMFYLKRKSISLSSRLFWLLATLWTLTILLVICFIGQRASRYIFPIDPFIFTISVLGMEVVGKAFIFYCRKKG